MIFALADMFFLVPRLPFGLAIAVGGGGGSHCPVALRRLSTPGGSGRAPPVNTGTFPNLNIPPAQAADN